MQLTSQGAQLVDDIARRYYLSADAVVTLLQAVANGGGTMAQFSHPELGGSGQWMQGGMTMVGDMFNHALKAKVDSLCSELSNLLASQPVFAPPAQTQAQSQGYPAASLFVDGGGGGQWWPSELGVPSSTGAQNNIRYAVFPSTRRLAIEIDGHLTVYDTLDHQIGGVGQQQGGGASLSFNSQYGLISVAGLPVVQGGAPTPQPSGYPADAPASRIPPPAQPHATGAQDGDIFALIEKLAELRQKGILTDEEFSAKKAELLGRL